MIDLKSLVRRMGAMAVAASMVLAVTGCGSNPNVNLSPEQQAATPDYEYLIGPGDTMEIFVWGNPDLSTNVVVKPDGTGSLRAAISARFAPLPPSRFFMLAAPSVRDAPKT